MKTKNAIFLFVAAVLSRTILAVSVSTVEELVDACSNALDNDVIELAAGTYKLNAELAITASSVTLKGADGTTRDQVVIDGQYACRCVNAKGSDFRIEGLTLANGFVNGGAPGSYDNGNPYVGAGLRLAANTPLVTNCVFTCCTNNTTAFAGGGAIGMATGVNNSNARVTDCLITKCHSAYMGSGVYETAASIAPKIDHTTFVECSGSSAVDTRNSGSFAILADCTFISNRCACIGNAQGATRCRFVFNKNKAFSCSHGRLSKVLFTDCYFATNYTADSGIITTRKTGQGRNDLFLTNCVFVGNAAKSSGGAIANSSGDAAVSAYKCEFTGNVASNGWTTGNAGGGAIFCSIGHLEDCGFTNNCTSASGGAICDYGYNLTSAGYDGQIKNCSFVGNYTFGAHDGNCSGGENQGEGGAAVAIYGAGHWKFIGCEFISNNMDRVTCSTGNHYSGGGAIYSRASAQLTDCLFEGNRAWLYGGALAGCFTGGVTRCRFIGNITDRPATWGNAGYYPKGTVYLYGWGNTARNNEWQTFNDCIFSNNVVYGSGGSAVYATSGRLRLSNCVFGNNFATNKFDSSIYGTVFIGDLSLPDGNNPNNFGMSGCQFLDNVLYSTYKAYGAGFYSGHGLRGYVRNSLFAGNICTNTTNYGANKSQGGAICVNNGSSTFSIQNCTFANNDVNTGASYGQGIYLTGSYVSVTNSIFYNNSIVRTPANNPIAYSCSNTQTLDADSGNLDMTDPRLTNDSPWPWMPARKSPCVNSGIKIGSWMTDDALDIRNISKFKRIAGGAPDMGCYEYLGISPFIMSVR